MKRCVTDEIFIEEEQRWVCAATYPQFNAQKEYKWRTCPDPFPPTQLELTTALLRENPVRYTCEEIRAELKRVSAGQVETWGFVAAFMDIIDRSEKKLVEHDVRNPKTPS